MGPKTALSMFGGAVLGATALHQVFPEMPSDNLDCLAFIDCLDFLSCGNFIACVCTAARALLACICSKV